MTFRMKCYWSFPDLVPGKHCQMRETEDRQSHYRVPKEIEAWAVAEPGGGCLSLPW